jgi:hypothetical protein
MICVVLVSYIVLGRNIGYEVGTALSGQVEPCAGTNQFLSSRIIAHKLCIYTILSTSRHTNLLHINGE